MRDQKTKVSDAHIGNFVESGAIVETWLTIVSRRDKSLRRYYVRHDKVRHTYLVFGILARDERSLKKYLSCYREFRESIRQFAD